MRTLTDISKVTSGPIWVHFDDDLPDALSDPRLYVKLSRADVRGYVASPKCAETLRQLSLPDAPCVDEADIPDGATVLRVQ
jgi:hypothetical protein